MFLGSKCHACRQDRLNSKATPANLKVSDPPDGTSESICGTKATIYGPIIMAPYLYHYNAFDTIPKFGLLYAKGNAAVLIREGRESKERN